MCTNLRVKKAKKDTERSISQVNDNVLITCCDFRCIVVQCQLQFRMHPKTLNDAVGSSLSFLSMTYKHRGFSLKQLEPILTNCSNEYNYQLL